MIKKSFYLLFIFFLLTLACKKADTSQRGNGDDEKKTEINIEQALFTNPENAKEKTPDHRIIDTLIHYINNVPESDTVYMSIFLLKYQPLISALKQASDQGAVVKVIVDHSKEESVNGNKAAIEQLSVALRLPSKLIVEENNITNTSINHEKYVLFSKIDLPQGIAKHVVFSTSHNFQLSDMKKVQDAIIVSNRKLYNIFLSNWKTIRSLADGKMINFEYEVKKADKHYTAYFFPRRMNGVWDGGDPILEVLDGLSDYSKDTICIGMAGFTNPRIKIAEKLVELQKKGVHVEIVTREENSESVLSKLSEVPANGGYLKLLNTSKENIHSKFMLIKGIWKGEKQTLILTGSENYSGNALYNNNEQLLMVKNSSLFNDYYSYFKRIKQVL